MSILDFEIEIRIESSRIDFKILEFESNFESISNVEIDESN